MPANFIDFVTSLVYGDVGTAELGVPPAGTQNHLNWSLDRLITSPASPGDDFLDHSVDVMLARYEAWRSKYFLPPVREWNGTNVFPHPGDPPVGPTMPPSLAGGAFPMAWTTNDLGVAVEGYWDLVRNFDDGRITELDDEIKAAFSYRYYAFMKWASNLRRRLQNLPVFPIPLVFDRDGTILSEMEFMDHLNDVHHVWHPNSGSIAPWTQATPGFATAAGQYRRKKELSRGQIGLEFFEFHREHLVMMDRWLARTQQDPVQSINTCGHDITSAVTPPALPSALSGLDVIGGGRGFPLIEYVVNPAARVTANSFNPPRANMWDGSGLGDGTLREFRSAGMMGQFFARDSQPFNGASGTHLPGSSNGSMIPVPGADANSSGYHGPGHTLNGDLRTPHVNNYSPRFFAWHGFIDDLLAKRQPRFLELGPARGDGTALPRPHVVTIIRDFTSSTDAIEPSNIGIDHATGAGTLRFRVNVRADPFSPARPLQLDLRCDILRESVGTTPVFSITRSLVVLAAGSTPGAANERVQTTAFVEDFAFTASMVDGDSHPAFHPDNKLFPTTGPSAAGFKNSLVRLSAHLYCTRDADGTTPAVPAGTLSSLGRDLTGAGTSFNSVLQQGDLIRAAGQVRAVSLITSNTAAQTTLPFDPALPAGTSFRRLDGFDYRESVEIPLVQEKLAPAVGIVLDRSTFSQDQVTAAAGGNPTATFPASFYVTVQDRTTRPAPIAWPPDTRPELYGVIAPPLRAAGLDPTVTPSLHLRVVGTSTSLAGTIDVAAGTAAQEDPSLHPSEAQRITWPVQVTFQGTSAFAGMASGSVKNLELVVTAHDRSGNTVTTVSDPIQLRLEANPLMLDGAVSWLSTDTRVFQIARGAARFGVASGWSDPNTFITAVITNFRSGSGTAGGETFESLPAAQAGSALEYSTTVGTNTIYNFALAKVRLQSATGAVGVRVGFRLFRWGTANVSFDPSLAYRVHTNGIPLLGRTAAGELASVPFFAEPRVALSASMTAQTDSANVHNFPATPASGAASYFGAFLDVNQSAARFPATFVNDGGFNTLPAADVLSIRNLLVDHHQCMVVEILYGPDPTRMGATPGNADNLAQRNLLILQTANPGDLEITRTVQHAFDLHLPAQPTARKLPDIPFNPAVGHHHNDSGDDVGGPGGTPGDQGDHHGAAPDPPTVRTLDSDFSSPLELVPAVRALSASTGDSERDARRADFAKALIEAAPDPGPVQPPEPSRSSLAGLADHSHGADSPLRGTFLDLDPDFVALSKARIHTAKARADGWRIDLNQWKPTDGVDELGFFWNDLPQDTRVDVFLPGAVVEHVFNLRSLRGAPRTVHIVDSHTLRLDVQDGVTWLPIPPFFGERLAGLVEMELPRGLKAGRRFRVDVIQARTRPRRILGGFQLLVAVEKTVELIPQAQRLAKILAQRLRVTPKDSRWYPILERRVAHARTLIPGLMELAAEEEPGWQPPKDIPGENDPRGRSLDPNADPFATPEGLQIRVVIERIDILDDLDPFLKGAGEFRFGATVHTPDEGGRVAEVRFPQTGHYDICDRGGRGGIDLECPIFEGAVQEKLAIEIRGVELDTFDPDDRLPTYRRIFQGKPEGWLGSYGPTESQIDTEDLGPWRIHYRIERL